MNESKSQAKQILAGVAQRIRQLRSQQGLSMSALAEKAGFTKSYLSQIENLKREPTIGTLVAIAHALGVEVFTILSGEQPEEQPNSFVLVRADGRREMKIPEVSVKDKLEAINHLKKGRLMDGYVLTSGFEFAEEPMAHKGQELLFILEGRQEFIYNGNKYILKKGDCCCFDANIPHYGRSIGKKESKALIVFSMPPTKE